MVLMSLAPVVAGLVFEYGVIMVLKFELHMAILPMQKLRYDEIYRVQNYIRQGIHDHIGSGYQFIVRVCWYQIMLGLSVKTWLKPGRCRQEDRNNLHNAPIC